MSQTIENDDGVEIEVYTAAELEEQKTAATTAAKVEFEATIKAKEEELVNLRKVSAEKTENFRKYNEMTEEERKAHSENEIIQIRRADQLAEELGTVKKSLEEKEIKEKEYTKNSTLKNFHGGNEELKKTIDINYAALAGMPETTAEEIQARASAAARLSGVSIDPRNPLYSGVSGEAPQYKERKEYTESPEGKEAADLVRAAMGIKIDNK